MIWGESGINGQHAFFQLLHQGTSLIPATFVGPAIPINDLGDHPDILLSNLFVPDRSPDEGQKRGGGPPGTASRGLSESEIGKVLPFKIFEGSKPASTILYKKLTPRTLGALIALSNTDFSCRASSGTYTVSTSGAWSLESSWPAKILSDLGQEDLSATGHDSSTLGLLKAMKDMRDQ